jgi:hypothetical protein
MLTLESLEKYAVSVHQLALSLDQRLAALESTELATTDSQQLKQAIAILVEFSKRQHHLQECNQMITYSDLLVKVDDFLKSQQARI